MIQNRLAAGLISAVVALGAMGCGSDAEPGETSSSADAVVGVTNLPQVEQRFGLVPGALPLGALELGKCYQAFVHDNFADGPPVAIWPTFEFRTYQNGVAYFATRGSGYNSGDYRPVVCVDVHNGRNSYSVSGVALDAITRYGLGTMTGMQQQAGRTTLQFSRGQMDFTEVRQRAERFELARRRPSECALEDAPTVYGRLDRVRVSGVAMQSASGATTWQDVQFPGFQAFFAFRYGWRLAETAGLFADERDPLGRLQSFTTGGEGTRWATAFNHEHLKLSYSGAADSAHQRTIETLAIDWLDSFDPQDTRPPLADCRREIARDPRTGSNLPPGPFRCTGI